MTDSKTETPTLDVADQRMLDLMQYCTAYKMAGVATQKDWCKVVGITDSNIWKVRNAVRGFSKEQYMAACTAFGVSMDWLFGFSNTMFRDPAVERKNLAKLRPSMVSEIPAPPAALKQKVKQKTSGE